MEYMTEISWANFIHRIQYFRLRMSLFLGGLLSDFSKPKGLTRAIATGIAFPAQVSYILKVMSVKSILGRCRLPWQLAQIFFSTLAFNFLPDWLSDIDPRSDEMERPSNPYFKSIPTSQSNILTYFTYSSLHTFYPLMPDRTECHAIL